MRSRWLVGCVVLCGGVIGCGPSDAGKQASGTMVNPAATARAEFSPTNFDESLAWLKTIQARFKGIENPLERQEAIERESKEVAKVNGTRVEWMFPVSKLHAGDPPSVELDGQKMRFGENIAVHFTWDKDNRDAGRVFLKAGEHVSKDIYRTLKAGAPVRVKGTLRVKLEGYIDIFIEDPRMD